MNVEVGKKALITTDAWFYAPDGKAYRAAFGTVRAVRNDQETLGVKTNARSANWYVEIGCITIAGCQVHYAIRCEDCYTGAVFDFRDTDAGGVQFERPSVIFDADANAPA